MFGFMFSHINDLFSIMNVVPKIKQLLDSTSNPKALKGVISDLVPTLVPIIEAIGATLFPLLAPEFHLVAGAIVSFDQDKNKWLQKSLNTILTDEEDLVVDGIYGPKTIEAVKLVQQHLGLDVVDGVAGWVTNTAIQFALNVIFAEAPAKAVHADELEQALAPAVVANITTTAESAAAPARNRPGGRP